MDLRVITWNLFHGRTVPPHNESALGAFARQLADWAWDVALLQEVPPWWPEALAAACGAQARAALTSRNQLLPLRRALGRRWPETMRSSGGANAILVRGTITAHAWRRLCLWPERRVVHAVRDGAGRWFANLHATVHDDAGARRDIALARGSAIRWAAGAPLVLGGDLNVRDPSLDGFVHAGGHDVDHVFARGLATGPAAAAEVLERGACSDHAPVRVTLRA
jgi:endonuclease/exonuclease/phosphatase family metal-dependent hydrolase